MKIKKARGVKGCVSLFGNSSSVDSGAGIKLIEKSIQSQAERCASAAPGIRSAAEAEGRRLQAVVRQLGRAYCRAGS